MRRVDRAALLPGSRSRAAACRHHRADGWRRYGRSPGSSSTSPPTWQPNPIFRHFRADPQGAPLKTPSGRIEIFSETIDGFGYDHCPGHPVWLPPAEWTGAATAEAPLHLVSPQRATSCTRSWNPHWRMWRAARPETILLHEADATLRAPSATCDLVRVFPTRARSAGAGAG